MSPLVDWEKSERKIRHLVFAIFWRKAVQRQEEFINGLSFRHEIADEKNARHGFPRANTVVSEVGHGIAVMSQETPFFPRCPSQDDGIGCFIQTGILNADHIQGG